MNKNKREGFTLIELIVVIAIIAILAAMAVPRVQSFVNDARETKRVNDFKSVYTSVHTGTVSWMVKAGNKLGTNRNSGANANVLSSACSEAGSGNETLQTTIEDRLPAEASLSDETIGNTIIFQFVGTSARAVKDHIIIGTLTDDSDSNTWETLVFADGGNDNLAGVLVYNDGFLSVNGGAPVELTADNKDGSFWVYNITDGKLDTQANVAP